MENQRKAKIQYRKATRDDLEFLVAQRLEFTLLMHPELSRTDARYEAIQTNSRCFFEEAFSHGTCDVILAEQDGQCIGTGIIFYYASVPSLFNPEGRNAYITSMYVEESYRHQGVGSQILERLILDAQEKGYSKIMLSASKMGRPLYEKHGFEDIQNSMLLNVK